MTYKESFLFEVKAEAEKTKKLLRIVPEKYFDWKPHEKSFSLSRLSSHVAELLGWISYILESDELDFAKLDYKPPVISHTSDLLMTLEENINKAILALEKSEPDDFDKSWTMRRGEQVFFTKCKLEVMRDFALNHMYHHRGQLTVYLRLLNVPLPNIYGPTADEKVM
jgi:uncharacterized damage-inducible protein DinB